MIQHAATFFKQASLSATFSSPPKALLSLLVGAFAALLCVQAQALAEAPGEENDTPIQVTSITVSATSGSSDNAHVIEGDSSGAVVHLYTNVGFTSVKWYVNETLVDTRIGDGVGTYDSLSGYDFAGLGSTAGNLVTVKAVAYSGDDNATGYAYVTVWDPVEINYYSATPQKVVGGGDETTICVTTNVPFTRVEYDIESDDPRTDNSSGTDDKESYISHTFSPVRPRIDSDYVERDITVTAYANIAGREVSSEPVTLTVQVFGGNGHVWQSVTASIDSWTPTDDERHHTYYLTSSHSARYYNDLADRQKLLVGRLGYYQAPHTNVWFRMQYIPLDSLGGNNLGEEITLDLTYSSSVSRTLTGPVSMKLRWYYGGYAYTRFGAWNDVIREETFIRAMSSIIYHGEGNGVPPTDSNTVVNDNWEIER